jgi:ATP-dependent DNA helicase 2 subunit 2
MARTRSVNLPPGPNGGEKGREISNLEWALQFVLLKVQEIVGETHFLQHNIY